MITPELKESRKQTGSVRASRKMHMICRIMTGSWISMRKFIEDDTGMAKIVSAYALDGNGMAAAVSKMAFGNGMGVKIDA